MVIYWWFNGDLMGFTLWLFNIAMAIIEIDGLPSYK